VDDNDDTFEPDLIAWPDVPRLCFGKGDDHELNACVSWVLGMRDIYPYAEGYRRAAAVLYETTAARHGSPDFILWPMAFMWRHYLELALKDTILRGRALAGEAEDFPKHHRLLDLWKVARPHIERCGSPDSPELPNVEAVIVEFERIDPGAMGFRYPHSKDGERSLPNAPDRVNLRLLHEAMEATANFFDAVRDEMSRRLDHVSEMLSQYR
jgi:hypothetical protein